MVIVRIDMPFAMGINILAILHVVMNYGVVGNVGGRFSWVSNGGS